MGKLEIYTKKPITLEQQRKLEAIKTVGGPKRQGHKRGVRPYVGYDSVVFGPIIRKDVFEVIGGEENIRELSRYSKGGKSLINVWKYEGLPSESTRSGHNIVPPRSRAQEGRQQRQEELNFQEYQRRLLLLPDDYGIPINEALSTICSALNAGGIKNVQPWQLLEYTPDGGVSLKKLSFVDKALHRNTWKYVCESVNEDNPVKPNRRLTSIEGVAARIVEDGEKMASLSSVIFNSHKS